jgi:hypothetical protein
MVTARLRGFVSCWLASSLVLASGDTPTGLPSASDAAPRVLANDITPPEKTTELHPIYPPKAFEAGREGGVILPILTKEGRFGAFLQVPQVDGEIRQRRDRIGTPLEIRTGDQERRDGRCVCHRDDQLQ